MKRKLSNIFISLPSKDEYLIEELVLGALHPDFIRDFALHFDLVFVEFENEQNNVCFAEDFEISQGYRTTFSKGDIIRIVLSQLKGQTFTLEEEVIL